MNLTFITTQQDHWGGSELLWVRMVHKVLAEKHRVQVVVFAQEKGLHPELLKIKNVVNSFIELPNFRKPGSLITKGFYAITNKIAPTSLNSVTQFNPDSIIISQANTYDIAFNTLFYNFIIGVEKKVFVISQFNTEHQGLSYGDIKKARLVFKKATNIFFVSQRNKEVAERQIAHAIDHAVFIDNPMNIASIDYIPFPSMDKQLNFASVARLDVNAKGQDILFQILSSTKWKERNWHLNLYGSGPDENYLKELAAYYNISSKVSFCGHVNSIVDVWKHNHILLMPSIAEGKPLAMEEAMICGRPCIMSDVAGNDEFIEHGKSGYLASSFLPNAFEPIMEYAWKDKSNWNQIGKEAHKSILSKLDLDVESTVLKYIL